MTEANYLLVLLNWLTAAVGPWLWASKIWDLLWDFARIKPPAWLHPRLAEATVNEFIIVFVRTFHALAVSLISSHMSVLDSCLH